MPSLLATLAIAAAEEIDSLAALDELLERPEVVARKRARFLEMVDAELAKLVDMRSKRALS